MNEKLRAFLVELGELSRKHDLYLEGCCDLEIFDHSNNRVGMNTNYDMRAKTYTTLSADELEPVSG